MELSVYEVGRDLSAQEPVSYVELEYEPPRKFFKRQAFQSIMMPVQTPYLVVHNVVRYSIATTLDERSALELAGKLARAHAKENEALRQTSEEKTSRPSTPIQKIKVRLGAPKYGCEVNLRNVVRAAKLLGFSIQGVTPDDPYNGVDSWKVEMVGKFEVEEIVDEN